MEKKSRAFFHASLLVVENARPTLVKYAADVVEKKLLAALYASAEVVDHARPTDEKYVALVVLKKSRLFFQLSALVVEKKNPLSMLERYDELSDVVAITLPCALVERSPDGMFEIARLVVVAFVVVELPVTMRLPTKVEDAALMTSPEVVALVPAVGCVHASYVVRPLLASVPQERTPALDALTSQAPLVRFVMANDVVVAFPKSAVVTVPDAIVVLPFAVSAPLKMLVPVKVFDEYILGMVVEASMKYVADVVDHERPTDAKY